MYCSSMRPGWALLSPPVPTGEAAPFTDLSWCTLPIKAVIDGVEAPVLFAGLAPGFVGVYQLNIQVPQLTPGVHGLRIVLAGTSSNEVSLPVGP